MKILHLTTHLNIGGITSYLYYLTQGLKKLGVNVQIASSGGEQLSDFHKQAIPIHFLPLNTKSEFSPRLVFSFFKLKKEYAREKWDIIHAHTRITQCLAYALSHHLKIPYITTVHGHHTPHIGRKYFPCLGHKTIAISSGIQHFLEEHYPSHANRLTTILHGIDTKAFDPHIISNEEKAKLKQKLGLKDLPILGNIARLSYEKGHVHLLEILKYLKYQKNSEAQLIIMGEGKQKDILLQKINASELKENIFLLPSQKDPRPILSLIDIYVSYHVAPEGFGLSFLEALAMGKPIVSRCLKGGFGDFIENGKEGFLLQEETIEMTAEKVYDLLISPSLREKMGFSGAQKAKNLFSYERMAKETKRVYEELL